MRFNKERWEFGKASEKEIKPFLESIIGEPLIPTSKFYDTMDFESESYLIELKTRSNKYHWDSPVILKEGWLLPECKIDRAKKETKKVLFFYFWASDQSLWTLEYSPEVFADLKPKIPFWNPDRQPHFYVPQDEWTRIC
jgi:hypothetical protein